MKFRKFPNIIDNTIIKAQSLVY